MIFSEVSAPNNVTPQAVLPSSSMPSSNASDVNAGSTPTEHDSSTSSSELPRLLLKQADLTKMSDDEIRAYLRAVQAEATTRRINRALSAKTKTKASAKASAKPQRADTSILDDL